MKTKLAVAALAALGIALQAGFLHAAVAAPLASAVGELRGPASRVVLEEEIVVQAAAKAPAAPRVRGS